MKFDDLIDAADDCRPRDNRTFDDAHLEHTDETNILILSSPVTSYLEREVQFHKAIRHGGGISQTDNGSRGGFKFSRVSPS